MRHDNDNALGIDFGSVCSGIEAASVAWHPLGMRAAWVSEIEPFPSAALAHHYPDTPNHGDMTTLASRVLAGEVHAPSVLVGGTPCQAFSVAGARAGLDDPRGRLTLSYVELADAIDHVRVNRGDAPCAVVWENVPGVLSSKDNAFGCFLGALAGEDCELQPSGKRWPDAGCVYGPQRAIAWRVLDAQYFGLAQRRRRVFVVASARDGFDPAAVLFERDGVRRDFAPSREARKDVAGTITGGARKHGGYSTDDVPLTVASTGDVSHCLNAGGMGRLDYETETLIVHSIQAGATRTNTNSGPDGVGVQEGIAYTLEARAEVQAVSVALRGREGGATAELGDDLAGCLRASGGGGDKPHVLAFGGQMSTPQVDVDLSQTLQAKNPQATLHAGAVRRLTPTECERLQGFPDGWTQVPYRGKPASDGPRYKALGNSMAVPVMRWIGGRIVAHLSAIHQPAIRSAA